MCEYKKVTDIDVLKKYYEIQHDMNKVGCWCDYVSIDHLARLLETSKYQIQKAYKSLKEKEYIKLEQIPTSFEEYDNGLYCETVPVLFSKAYILTKKGMEKAKELGGK